MGLAWKRREGGRAATVMENAAAVSSSILLLRCRGEGRGEIEMGTDKAEKGGLTATHEKKGHKLLQCNSRESG